VKQTRPAFDVVIAAKIGAAHAAFLDTQLRRARGMVKSKLVELAVALVDHATMSRLHRQYMGILGPTDVLTFPLDHDSKGKVLSGEVVVCVTEAERAARRRKIPLQHELLLYALHGMLHLSGFDDKTQAGFAKMHRTEDSILKRLGVGPVFATEAPTAHGILADSDGL
jgi:probable rRNA maturation factor